MNNILLLQRAQNAALRAYAPYSHFRVGAAVLLSNGEIIEGNNQENSSFGLTMCAERVALNYAKSLYPDQKVVALALSGLDSKDVVAPCGACRQVFSEIALRQGSYFKVIMGSQTQIIEKNSSELLPMVFELP
ncbi:MAG: cytidine deaminase [Mucinivorans sp.]